MNPARFQALADRYRALKIAVIGDFCLDRYLEIDPARGEVSIETGLPVHNVLAVRAQPGGAGTILNNLAALGLGHLHPVGFCGVDGEGFELRGALRKLPGVSLDQFLATEQRRTFTYCKPLLLEPGRPPRELSRLDSKNWDPTPPELASALAAAITQLAPRLDALVLLDQVEVPGTGVLCAPVLEAVQAATRTQPRLLAIGDSRRSLHGYPPMIFKMNRQEFAALTGRDSGATDSRFQAELARFAQQLGQPVFVTAAEQGIFGASPEGQIEHQPALPVRGPIDIVGAGDAVTANLIAALAAGASLREAILVANAAASVVVHKLGTTGTASPGEILPLLTHD